MKKILIVVLILVVNSCDDIVGIDDLSDKKVTLLAPADGTVFESSSSIKFSWNAISSAEYYQIQIASPSFEEAVQIIIDSTLETSSFSKTLDSSNYEWRVRAINSAYATPYSKNSFEVRE